MRKVAPWERGWIMPREYQGSFCGANDVLFLDLGSVTCANSVCKKIILLSYNSCIFPYVCNTSI